MTCGNVGRHGEFLVLGGQCPNHSTHVTIVTHTIQRIKHDFSSREKEKREKTVQCLFLLSLHRDLPGALTVQSGGEKVRMVPQNDQQGTLSKSYLPLLVSPALFPTQNIY